MTSGEHRSTILEVVICRSEVLIGGIDRRSTLVHTGLEVAGDDAIADAVDNLDLSALILLGRHVALILIRVVALAGDDGLSDVDGELSFQFCVRINGLLHGLKIERQGEQAGVDADRQQQVDVHGGACGPTHQFGALHLHLIGLMEQDGDVAAQRVITIVGRIESYGSGLGDVAGLLQVEAYGAPSVGGGAVDVSVGVGGGVAIVELHGARPTVALGDEDVVAAVEDGVAHTEVLPVVLIDMAILEEQIVSRQVGADGLHAAAHIGEVELADEETVVGVGDVVHTLCLDGGRDVVRCRTAGSLGSRPIACEADGIERDVVVEVAQDVVEVGGLRRLVLIDDVELIIAVLLPC